MTWNLEVEQLLWGLRWAVLGPHRGAPARTSPAASPSASTVRPGSLAGAGEGASIWELGTVPTVHPLPSPGLPVTLLCGLLSSSEVRLAPSSPLVAGRARLCLGRAPGSLGCRNPVPGLGGNTPALALGPGWAWESCAAWQVRKGGPGLWEERLRDELSGDPVPVRGSGLSSRRQGAWARRGEQSRYGLSWQPITGQ